MPHWRLMIEKDYLGAWDLVDKAGAPKDYTLTIAAVKSVAVKTKDTPRGKRKVVIRFKEARKAFISNSTNCTTIEAMYGRDTDGWVGQKVTLYQTPVQLGPKTVQGIRVRPRKPTGPAEQIEEREVDPDTRAAQNEAAAEVAKDDRGDSPDDY